MLTNRIYALDAIRGFALMGILIMNIPGFAFPRVYPENIVLFEGVHTLNYYAWMVSYIFFHGKMRFLFSMVFGAGILLFTGKKEAPSLGVADAYFRRMMWLLVFALFTSYILLASTSILYEYALCGMLLFVFRKARVRWLLLITVISFIIFSAKAGMGFLESKEQWAIATEARQQLAQGKSISKEQQAAIDFWKNGRLPQRSVLDEQYANDISLVNAGYLAIFAENANEHTEIFSIEFYSAFWETFGTIALGMALFKLGFFSGRLKKSIYVLLATAGLMAGLVFAWHIEEVETKGRLDITGWFFSTRWFSIFHMEQIPRTLCAVGYASLLILLCQARWFKPIAFTLSCLGRMAFTNYLCQNIFCALFFFILGGFARLDFYLIYPFALSVWIVQAVFSILWLRNHNTGPFEWLWRRLTYGKSFRKEITLPSPL